MGHVKVRALVLKLTDVKDYDRYITLLTGQLGILSVYAKGIKRPKNPMGARLQLFSFVDVVLFENKGKYHLNDAELIFSFRRLREDMLCLTAASQLAELIIDQTHEPEEAADFYELFIRACYALEKADLSPYFIAWLSELKILFSIGYKPELYACDICGSDISINDTLYFDHKNGGMLCTAHGAENIDNYRSEVVKISPDLYRVLFFIDQSEVASLFSVRADRELIDELGLFTLRYTQLHLDKEYNKFSFFREFGLG